MVNIGKINVKVTADASGFEKGLNKAKLAANKFVSDVRSKLTVLASGALAGLGYTALKVASDFDDALQKIAVGTGAAGKSLRDFGEDMTFALQGTANSIPETAQALQSLNTILGLTGQELRDTAKDITTWARLTNSSAETVATKFGQMYNAINKHNGSAQQSFNTLVVIAQATGATIEQITTQVQMNSAAFNQMGVSAEEAAGMIGLMIKNGVRLETAMSGLRQGVANVASTTKTDIRTAILGLVEQISTAESEVEKLNIANKRFGKEGGPAFVEMINKGVFQVDAFLKSLGDTTTAVNKTDLAITTWKESLSILVNDNLPALKEAGDAVIRMFEGMLWMLEKVESAMDKAGESWAVAFLGGDEYMKRLDAQGKRLEQEVQARKKILAALRAGVVTQNQAWMATQGTLGTMTDFGNAYEWVLETARKTLDTVKETTDEMSKSAEGTSSLAPEPPKERTLLDMFKEAGADVGVARFIIDKHTKELDKLKVSAEGVDEALTKMADELIKGGLTKGEAEQVLQSYRHQLLGVRDDTKLIIDSQNKLRFVSSAVYDDIKGAGKNAFDTIYKSGSETLKNLASEFGDWGDLVFNVLKNVAAVMMGGGSGKDMFTGIVNGIFSGNAFGNIIGGFFADGGEPPLNKVSVVGERGPELFVPKVAGTVIPNDQSFSQGNGWTTYNEIHIGEGVDARVAAYLRQAWPDLRNDAVRATMSTIAKGGKSSKIVRNA